MVSTASLLSVSLFFASMLSTASLLIAAFLKVAFPILALIALIDLATMSRPPSRSPAPPPGHDVGRHRLPVQRQPLHRPPLVVRLMTGRGRPQRPRP